MCLSMNLNKSCRFWCLFFLHQALNPKDLILTLQSHFLRKQLFLFNYKNVSILGLHLWLFMFYQPAGAPLYVAAFPFWRIFHLEAPDKSESCSRTEKNTDPLVWEPLWKREHGHSGLQDEAPEILELQLGYQTHAARCSSVQIQACLVWMNALSRM